MMERNLEQQDIIQSKDITEEFLAMDNIQFIDFLRQLKKEPILSIVIDWKDNNPYLTETTLSRLKAFLEETKAKERGQKRQAIIRATEEQKNGPILSQSSCQNAFASGVKWERV